jgi:glycine/D-amino acid oxidase-like deaminating enzyme
MDCLTLETSQFSKAYFVFGFCGNGITFSVIGMELVSEMLKTKNIL